MKTLRVYANSLGDNGKPEFLGRMSLTSEALSILPGEREGDRLYLIPALPQFETKVEFDGEYWRVTVFVDGFVEEMFGHRRAADAYMHQNAIRRSLHWLD